MLVMVSGQERLVRKMGLSDEEPRWWDLEGGLGLWQVYEAEP